MESMLSNTWRQIHTSWVQKIAHLDLHLCFLTASVTNKYTQQHSRISVQSLHCGCTNKSNLLGTCMWVCPWRTASSRADPPNRSLQNFRCHQAIVINHSKFRDAHFFLKSESIRRCLQVRSALFSKRNSTMFWCPSDEARCWNAQTSQRYLWMAPHYGRSESEDQSRGPSPAPFFCRSPQNWQRLRFQPVSSPRLSCHHKQPVNIWLQVRISKIKFSQDWNYLAHEDACLLSWENESCTVLAQYGGYLVVTGRKKIRYYQEQTKNRFTSLV